MSGTRLADRPRPPPPLTDACRGVGYHQYCVSRAGDISTQGAAQSVPACQGYKILQGDAARCMLICISYHVSQVLCVQSTVTDCTGYAPEQGLGQPSSGHQQAQQRPTSLVGVRPSARRHSPSSTAVIFPFPFRSNSLKAASASSREALSI